MSVVDRYLELGLRMGKHIDGFVDAYYGPDDIKRQVEREPIHLPAELAADAARLIADLDAGIDDVVVGPGRRRWLRAQVVGVHTTARKLNGELIGYADEVETCYGVRPRFTDEEVLEDAHRRLDAVMPGTGPLMERYITWREAQAVPTEKLRGAIATLADDFHERTQQLFGLPDGEHIDFDLVTNEPWSGFNYYLGDLHSRVVINTDLPVLSISLGHLVAHEAYPGHHTEHSRKEAGLVRQHGHTEETIFLVGTPQCLLAEGLADLGIEVLLGEDREQQLSDHLRPLGIPYDAEVITNVRHAGEAMNAVRANVALLLHEAGKDADDVVQYAMRWGLTNKDRAEKMLQFQTDPTWRAYTTCYVEGLPLCRNFVNGDPARFERLITEQLLPVDLIAA